MKRLDFGRHMLGGFAVAALLAGCGGPSGNEVPQTAGAPSHRQRSSSATLIYAVGDNLYVLSYPNVALVSTIHQQGFGICSDGVGNVWVADAEGHQLVEYAHGGTTPIATLSDSGQYPASCSVDPSTGNLAVVNSATTGSSGTVAIYANAQGTPSSYTDPDIYYPGYCGYDNAGNLLVDGQSKSGTPEFALLPTSSKSFTNITLNKKIADGGAILWDGSYMTVQDREAGKIYRIAIAGSKGTIVGKTALTKWLTAEPTPGAWIFNGTFVAPTATRSTKIGLWAYPQGGKPTSVFSILPKHGDRFRALTLPVASSP